MKRKRLIAFLMCVLFIVLFFQFYLDSVLATILVNQVQVQSGIQLEYQDIDISLLPGWVTLKEPRFWTGNDRDQGYLGGSRIVKLDFDLLRSLSGSMQLERFFSSGLTLEIKPMQDDTNWGQAIKNMVKPAPISPIIAQAKLPAASAVRAASTTQSTTMPVPAIQSEPLAPKSATAAVATADSASAPVSATAANRSSNPAPSKPAPSKPATNPRKNEPMQIPSIEIRNAQLNYHHQQDGATRIYGIQMERLYYDPASKQLLLSNANVTQSYREARLFSIQELSYTQAEADGLAALRIEGTGLTLDSQKTGEARFDLNQVIELWKGVYQTFQHEIRPGEPSTTQTILDQLALKDVSIALQPESGMSQAPGAVQFLAGEIRYSKSIDELVFVDVQMHEAGESALGFRRLVFQGINRGWLSLSNVVLEGLRLEVREGNNRQLNIQRAVSVIRSMVESLLPKSETTALAPAPGALGVDVMIKDSEIAYQRIDQPQQRFRLDSFELDAETSKGNAKELQVQKDNRTLLHVPAIQGRAVNGNNWRYWDTVNIDKSKLDFDITKSGWEFIHSASDWIRVGKAIVHGLDPTPSGAPRAWVFQNIHFNQLSAILHETRTKQPINLYFEPIQVQLKRLQFSHPQPTATEFSIKGELLYPSPGTLDFQGKVTPPFDSWNLDGALAFTIQNFETFKGYYEENMPVGIKKSGLRFAGPIQIKANQIDSTFDLFLDQPEFQSAATNMPVKYDNRTAVTALNGMKDSKGVITFRDNRLSGNIKDPQFSFGVRVSEILARNVWNRTTQILKLPLNVVETGANAIGGLFKAIIGK